VVQHAKPHARRLCEIDWLERPACLQEPEEMKGAVENAQVLVGSDDDCRMPVNADTPNDIAFRPG
jgi:hypothetical protein